MRGILIICFAFVFACFGLVVVLRAGVIRTLEGKTYTGEIGLDTPGVISITSSGGGTKTQVPVGDVLQASFRGRGASGTMPAPWTVDEIGDVTPGGSASFAGGVFTLKGAQASVAMQLVHRELIGDGEISARVIDFQNARSASYAGVIMASGIGSDRAFVSLVVNPAGNVGLIYRTRDGAALQTTPATKLIVPCWLKLSRQARRFVGYKSVDGRNWEPLDPAVAADLGHESQVGLALCSGDKSAVVTARLDNVNIVGATPAKIISATMGEGIVLKDGTAIPGKILGADENSVTMDDSRGRKSAVVPIAQVARLLFVPIPARQIPGNRIGALLTSGDFFDGEFKGLSNGAVRISSVLFGIKSFNVGTQAAGVILGEAGRPSTPFVVRLTDGAVVPCEKLEIGQGRVTGTNALLGTVSFSQREIDRIDRSGNAFESLCDLKPIAGAVALDSGVYGVGDDLIDLQVDRAIGLAAGSQVSYELGGKYRSLIGTLGVPAELLPYQAVTLVILADGQEIYRSPAITSVDDPLPVAVSLMGKGQLTLKLESAGDAGAAPGQAIIADPLLVRK